MEQRCLEHTSHAAAFITDVQLIACDAGQRHIAAIEAYQHQGQDQRLQNLLGDGTANTVYLSQYWYGETVGHCS